MFTHAKCCMLATARYEKVGSEGYHSLFRWYSAFEAAQFPDPSGLRARLSAWTLGEPSLLHLVCVDQLPRGLHTDALLFRARGPGCVGVNMLRCCPPRCVPGGCAGRDGGL